MKVKSWLLIILALMLISCSIVLPVITAHTFQSATWTAKWIWQSTDGPANTWMCFRKTFNLGSAPASAMARIAVDSRYWMWVNGNLVIRDGGLKRGPTPTGTYYDEVDLKNYLTSGSNNIAILVWYWGRQSFTHSSSGIGGLLFEAPVDAVTVKSDNTWKIKVHPAYYNVPGEQPNYRLAEQHEGYNARLDTITGWTNPTFNDSGWSNAVERGTPPCTPWGEVDKRVIPMFKHSDTLSSYTNEASFPTGSSGATVTAILPINQQVYPYLKVNAGSDGLIIGIQGVPSRSDAATLRGEYKTKVGIQEYEMHSWLSGENITYQIPAGVQILELKYRATGYDTDFTKGAFSCNDSFYNTLRGKALNTLKVCMRDHLMDCPDRERANWGDSFTEIPQTFYSCDANALQLAAKSYRDFFSWQRGTGVIHQPVPSDLSDNELPSLSLTACGMKGVWKYYMYTGDTQAAIEAYPHIKNYLYLWSMGGDGMVVHRSGTWDWYDWGGDIDSTLLQNLWYYSALKAAINLAQLSGNTGDIPGFDARKTSIENNFDTVFWTGTAYRSPGYSGATDDRANSLAVVIGPPAVNSKWSYLRDVLVNQKHCGPFYEIYPEEALFQMGYPEDALDRMRSMYAGMVNSSISTLWECWDLQSGNYTYNHAYAGGPLVNMSQYVAGVGPETNGYGTYHVLPQLGRLTSVSAVVPSVKGDISVSVSKGSSEYDLNLASPANTVAIVGIAKDSFGGSAIKVNNTVIWQNGSYSGGVSGISYNGEDSQFVKFNANPGTWSFVATPGVAVTVKVDDSDSAVIVGGTWTTDNFLQAYLQTRHYSNSTGAYGQFTFTGKSVKWIGETDTNRGKADIYIDSVLDATIDTYGVQSFQQMLYQKTGLTSAQHTIKVVCNGTKNSSSSNYYITLDAFEYSTGDLATPTPTPAATPTNTAIPTVTPTSTPTPNPATTIIIDDDSSNAVFTGAWTRATDKPTQQYSASYRYAAKGNGSIYTVYTPNITTAGNYKVYAWWTDNPNCRASDAPYIIYYNGGNQTISVDQRTNGGQWILLGTFNFATGTSGYVKITNAANDYVIADAVKFELNSATPTPLPTATLTPTVTPTPTPAPTATPTVTPAITIIVDDDNSNAVFTGAWTRATDKPAQQYGASYRYAASGNGSIYTTYTPTISSAGDYKVYARWTDHIEFRASNTPYVINYNGGSQTVRVDQWTNGGQWILLGTFNFAAGTSGYVRVTNDADNYVIADAVKFEK
jgi:alpha-L-rhamnosidase